MTSSLKPWLSLKFILPAILILALYLFTRLYQLTLIPVFVDEAIYIRWSQIMKNEPSLRFLPLSDGKQPLFMWLTMPAFKLFTDPLFAGRFVSVLAGLGTLLGIGFVTWQITRSQKIALLSAFVYTLTPYALFFDRMALVDSLLSMFGVWCLGLGLVLVHHPRLDLAMILGFFLGGALLTKSPAVFFLYLQPALLINVWPFKRRHLLKLIACWVISGIIGYAIYNILRLGPNFHLVNSRNQDYLYSFSEVLTHPFNPLKGNLLRTLEWATSLLTWPLILASLLSLLHAKLRRFTLILWLWVLIPTLAQSAIAKVYTSRYWLYVTPYFICLTGITLDFLFRFKKNAALGFIAIFAIISLLTIYPLYRQPDQVNFPQEMEHGYFQEWTAGYGQKEIAQYLAAQPADKKILVATEGFFGSLPDGLQIYTQRLPNVTVIGSPWPVGEIPPQLIAGSVDHTAYLVLNQSRLQLTRDQFDRLELIASYPKPARPDGTHETLLFYKLIK